MFKSNKGVVNLTILIVSIVVAVLVLGAVVGVIIWKGVVGIRYQQSLSVSDTDNTTTFCWKLHYDILAETQHFS